MADPQALIFEPGSGIAGDMVLGALVDLLGDGEPVVSALRALPVDGWDLRFERVELLGLSSMRAHVHAPETETHRHLSDIESLLKGIELPGGAAARALDIFRRLAEAEGKIHGVPASQVHFHEVGALDAIVDIVGSAVALELLGVESIHTGPVSLGQGTVRCAHGLMPLPAPATLELLSGFPTVQLEIPLELTTPTGAAILAATATPLPAGFASVPLRAGYGAGTRTLPDQRPNVLRARLVRLDGPPSAVSILETNVDDLSPEIVPYVLERLFEHGALDAYVIPTIMKRGRPGVIVGAIVPKAGEREVAEILLSETGSLGVRVRHGERYLVQREMRRVVTRYGSAGVKLARLPDGSWRAAPEYRDCAALARDRGVPLMDVMASAREAGNRLADQLGAPDESV